MRRHGLERESKKFDLKQTVDDFNKDCEVHPVLMPVAKETDVRDLSSMFKRSLTKQIT